ncbi:52 kDa repressor of the inhibitor of the protein kinase-like isoform X2 [Microplitis mediator]|uniref:52 kDa repressor of the inhibitor of the protein kinase-like isoform X2 n=1 Tax=Microplitis mediator TaxID=375433 RepID=UPI002553F6AE|nr:52 kDa repressor of the inhibitor of the protein kinase-like isoform X2 [Microplitis mediator]
MVKLCFLCDRKPSKADKISFHKFPRDEVVRQKWLDICGLTPEDDVSRICICSTHFTASDMISCSSGIKKSFLKSGAVPTKLLSNPLVIKEADDASKLSKRRSDDDPPVDIMLQSSVEELIDELINEIEDLDDDSNDTPKKQRIFYRPRYISEITLEDLSTPCKAERVLKLIKATDLRKSKQIKSLQDQRRQLHLRIKSLKDLISHLQSRNSTQESEV